MGGGSGGILDLERGGDGGMGVVVFSLLCCLCI